MTISVFNIRDMILAGQEALVASYLATFSCCKKDAQGNEKLLNPDIEHFLKANAVQFAKMKTAITYFVFDADDGAFLGYFTLAHKSLSIPSDGLSRKIKEKIKRFSSLDESDGTYTVSAFLLAQLGKNYRIENGSRIAGKTLMAIAKEKLSEIQNSIGGTIVYLDCEADANLINFYEAEGFTLFGERISSVDGKRYLQYIAFI